MNLEANNLDSLAKLTTDGSSNLSDDNRKTKLKKACQDLEALFLRQLMKSMRKTVPKSGLLEKGMAQDTYREMLDREFAKRMSHSSGIGLARILYRQLVEDYGSEKN